MTQQAAAGPCSDGRTSTARIVAGAAYASVAVASNFVIKAAGSVWFRGAPDVVLVLQLAVIAAAVHVGRVAGWVSWTTDRGRLAAFLPLSLAYGAHAALVLRALASLNVPMYNVLKRMAPVMVLAAKAPALRPAIAAQAGVQRRAPSPGVTGSVLLTVAGCIVAGLGDLAADLRTYALAIGAAALQAAYLLLAEYAAPSSPASGPRVIALTAVATGPEHGQPRHHGGKGEDDGVRGTAGVLSSSPAHEAACAVAEALYWAAVTCLPLAAAAALATGQIHAACHSLSQTAAENGLIATARWLVAIASIELLLGGSIMYCARLNSALTTTVLGVLKGILAVGLGFVIGRGAPELLTRMGITGVAMNCAGGVWYVMAKHKEQQAQARLPTTHAHHKPAAA